MSVKPGSVVLFDGECNLCNTSVRFIMRNDPAESFDFISLQSEEGHALLRRFGKPVPEVPDTLILIENGKIFERSDAVFRIAGRLRFPWKLLKVFRFLPRYFRDGIYNMLARRRYALFGKHDIQKDHYSK